MRVLDVDGIPVGVGVLVGPREILTCAHVVNSALGRDRQAQDHPASEVTVEFAVGIAAPELAVAAVARWDPADAMLATNGEMSSVAFSPDGTMLAVPRDRSVEIIDLVSGDTLCVLHGHTGRVLGCPGTGVSSVKGYRRGRSPTMMQVSSQHCRQVGHSHSMSPSVPRG